MSGGRFDGVSIKRDSTTAKRALESMDSRASTAENEKKPGKKTERIQLLLTPDMLNAVDSASVDDGRSRNSWIGKAIAEKLERDSR